MGGTEPTTAHTYVPEDKDMPSQIQICPYFMNWIKKGTTEGTTQPHPQTISDLIFLPNSKTNWWPFMTDTTELKSRFYQAMAKSAVKHDKLLSPIDVFSLFDKILLHELTHTRPGRKAVDVDSGGVLGGITKVRYGWKRCRSLAQENPNDTDKYKQWRFPGKNADSIALMCNAVNMLEAEGTTVGAITETGQVKMKPYNKDDV